MSNSLSFLSIMFISLVSLLNFCSLDLLVSESHANLGRKGLDN